MSNYALEASMYDDMVARPDFYKTEWGFDPLRYLRQSADEEGRTELSLDVKFRKHWFRLVYPSGKITARPVDVNERFAIFMARVYADRGDPEENYLAEGTAIRYCGGDDAKAYEKFFVDWSETIAIGRALSNAGFDVPWCNIPMEVNQDTGEVVSETPKNANPVHPYPDVTAPPPQTATQTPAMQQAAPPQPAAQTPAMQQTHPPQPVAQTPAMQQAAPPQPAAQAPAIQQAAPLPTQQPRNLEEAMQSLGVEQAKALVVNFGQNNGKTLGQIAVDNPKDLDWLATKYKGGNFMLKAGAQILTAAALQQAS